MEEVKTGRRQDSLLADFTVICGEQKSTEKLTSNPDTGGGALLYFYTALLFASISTTADAFLWISSSYNSSWLLHTVFPELFMLACHIRVCSFLVFINLSAPSCFCPSLFLPSISSLPSLAHLLRWAVGLAMSIHTASSFHPFFLSGLFAPCWCQGIQK